MEQHKHKWYVETDSEPIYSYYGDDRPNYTDFYYAVAKCSCGKTLNSDEIANKLNELEDLKTIDTVR